MPWCYHDVCQADTLHVVCKVGVCPDCFRFDDILVLQDSDYAKSLTQLPRVPMVRCGDALALISHGKS